MHIVGFIIRIYHDARSPEVNFINQNVLQPHARGKPSNVLYRLLNIYIYIQGGAKERMFLNG